MREPSGVRQANVMVDRPNVPAISIVALAWLPSSLRLDRLTDLALVVLEVERQELVDRLARGCTCPLDVTCTI
jgi:hypothetical protein